jgi:P4 family phage/plasmid primase-like protien
MVVIMTNDGQPWDDADWQNPNSGQWPDALLDREQWMGQLKGDKQPFAPWGDEDAPAPCSKAGHDTAATCECDARFKWGYEEHYLTGEKIEMAHLYDEIEGRAFLQQEEDPFSFVDGDDVRCPKTGDVHPAFIDILNRFGVTYADVSTSATGAHANYEGELPNDIPEAKWKLDDEPWGENDDLPAIEIYSNRHVCVATGERVPGSAKDVQPWDDEAVREVLDENDELQEPSADRSSLDLDDHDPDATESTETTTDIKDIFHALDRLDPKRVGDKTIVSEWTGDKTFLPTWGNRDDGGTANYIDDRIWNDTGHDGGYGGPAVMAAIDAGLVRHAGATPSDVSGETFFKALEHLRDLGFSIPKLKTGSHEFDVIADDSESDSEPSPPEPDAAQSKTDGGTVAEEDNETGVEMSQYDRFESDVHDAISEVSDDEMTQRSARQKIAEALVKHYNFVYPEAGEVRGWRNVLYIYDPDVGIYEPRGEARISSLLERAAGGFVTNQVINEVVSKVERKTTENDSDGEFKPDPEKLVVENGLLNLFTGELSPVTPTEYHRRKIGTRWNPDGDGGEAFDSFLHDLVDDNDVVTLYRLIAHTLFKGYPGEKAAILIGSGENGKSVFLDIVEQFIGTWNVAHRELQDFDADGFAANNLEGKLANLATEIGEQTLQDATIFKKLTGRDTIDAKVKFEKPITFKNHATLMFSTNEMPVFKQDNHAIWRRWVYVNFPYEFSSKGDKEPVPKSTLMNRLTQESEFEALLVRCQQEIQRWHESDESFFADSMEPEKLRDKMKKAAEPVYNFASTCLQVGNDDDAYVKKSEVRACYRAYADEEDLPTVPEQTFGERLLQLRDFNIESKQKRFDGSQEHVYENIQLSSRGRQVLGVDEPDADSGQSTVEFEQAEPIVMDELRTMIENNDGQPVSRNALAWRAAGGQMGKQTAENAIDNLAKKGEVIDGSDGLMPTSK